MNAPGSPSSALQMTYLASPGRLAREPPLVPVGKPAPPRPRRPDCVIASTTSSGSSSTSTLASALVAAVGQVVVDGVRVDLAVEPQHAAPLLAVEGDVLLVGDALLGLGVLVEALLVHAVADDARLDDLGDVLGPHVRVEDALGPEHDDRPLLAEAVAAGLDHAHGVGQAAAGELRRERLRAPSTRPDAWQAVPAQMRISALPSSAM